MAIETVKDLKAFLQDLPDDMLVLIPTQNSIPTDLEATPLMRDLIIEQVFEWQDSKHYYSSNKQKRGTQALILKDSFWP